MNKITNIKGAAPMPKREDKILNPMKLYTYLVCISGLATYPENTRMFRHKNLVLTKIKNAIGITDKTAKLYLYQLELAGLIEYQGQCKRLPTDELENILLKYEESSEGTKERKINEMIGAQLWKKRNKLEKEGVYYIPRPDKWTPIPEITLKKLNEDYGCSELEMKLFLLCCSYRDLCYYEGKNKKNITFELVRDTLKIKRSGSEPNKEIRKALFFLKELGLINFVEKAINNNKGGQIPCFELKEVNYYITYEILTSNEEIETINAKELRERIELIYKSESEKNDRNI